MKMEEHFDGVIALGFHEDKVYRAELANDIDFAGVDYESIDFGYEHVTLDGKGHTLKNITLSTYEEDKDFGIGLFKGNVKLKDITFENVNITYQGQTSVVGGIVGVLKMNYDNQGYYYENVSISGTINAPNAECVGGFVGMTISPYNEKGVSTLTASNCTSEMTINGKLNVGGIIGRGSLNGQTVVNKGTVKGKDNVGGIVGRASGEVIGGENYGKVESANIAGGVAGVVDENVTVGDSKNGGEVTGVVQTGGIVGLLNKKATIKGCVNLSEGKVVATGCDSDYNAKVGGIVGATDKETEVYNCINQGTVSTVYHKVGGIVGYSLGGIVNCKHEGTVEGTNDVGGIVGHMKSNSTVTTCVVTGTVKGASRVGGVMGRFGSDDWGTKIKSDFGKNDLKLINCSVSGEITADSYGGGLIGLVVIKDTLDGDYLNTNTFDGKLTINGAASTTLFVQPE